MKITTNHPQQELAKELAKLFDKYDIKEASGCDDGSLNLYLEGLICWVSFDDESEQ